MMRVCHRLCVRASVLFFCKQKTAYEMRISDWSADVCSSDLDWQKDATRALATGRTGEAIHAYAEHGMVHAAETREAARAELIDTWDAQRLADPEKTRIILTHTNAEVRDLNQAARDRLREAGELGQDVRISAERGAREFATGDRIMFLKNERGLGVKHGTLGKVERVSPDSMAVRPDAGRPVAFDLKD